MSFSTVYKDGAVIRRDTKWSLNDVGLSREEAIANMAMRAMRHVEWLGTLLIRDILEGKADPGQPYLIRDEETGVYLWFCIVREGCDPPAFPDAS